MKGPVPLGSAAVGESVDSGSEVAEDTFAQDDDELERLEADLVVIEEAMGRVEEGDLEGYDFLVERFDNREKSVSDRPTGAEESV